ncbi:putative mitochondrial import inner membrane translocase subunit TIM21 [Bienertia sinuspersici]
MCKERSYLKLVKVEKCGWDKSFKAAVSTADRAKAKINILVNFHIRGPNGDGKVYCEMFKDKADNQWKYMYLIVDVLHPSPTKLFLESFLPA